MKKRVLFAAIVAACTLSVNAQKSEKGEGKFILTSFANFNTGFGKQNDERGFELERAYLGYQYKFDNGIEIKTVADFGQSKEVSDMQRIGFIKNAYIGWSGNGWKIYGGLISTTQFKTQEDFWGKRYIMKSFQDEYKFGSSADLGISASYSFCPQVSADVILINGEGYKKLQVGDGLLYGAGVTVRPANGFVLRAYGSFKEKDGISDIENTKGIANMAGFAGYKNSLLSVGAEYNYQMNTDYVDNEHLNGTSLYASVKLNKKIEIFGRWDYMNSNHSWNTSDDGMAGVAGVEFKPCKQFKVAPTFRMWSPDANDADKEMYAYINASFSL